MLLDLGCCIYLSLWYDEYRTNIDYEIKFGMCVVICSG
jgi:hypothetical protein